MNVLADLISSKRPLPVRWTCSRRGGQDGGQLMDQSEQPM